MRHVRKRHIIRKLKRSKPIRIAIERARTKSRSIEFSYVMIDPTSTTQEFFMFAKKITIVIEIVNVHLKALLSNAIQK